MGRDKRLGTDRQGRQVEGLDIGIEGKSKGRRAVRSERRLRLFGPKYYVDQSRLSVQFVSIDRFRILKDKEGKQIRFLGGFGRNLAGIGDIRSGPRIKSSHTTQRKGGGEGREFRVLHPLDGIPTATTASAPVVPGVEAGDLIRGK